MNGALASGKRRKSRDFPLVFVCAFNEGGEASSFPQAMPSFASSVGGGADDSGHCDDRGDLGIDTERRDEQTRASSGDNVRR